jgi:oxygen-independent coproporphyrinogen-3 oxidase
VRPAISRPRLHDRVEGRFVLEKPLNGLYIHIPFCTMKCAYCDFPSVALQKYWDLKTYLTYLQKELRLYKGIELQTIYIGGGTPSLIRPADFFTLVQTVRNVFHIEKLEEFSVEVNPESLSKEHVAVFFECGVNRVSLGVQSFHTTVLERVGRCAGIEDIQEALLLLQDCRSIQLNVDLLMGIAPLGIYRDDLKKTAELSPSHISVYMLDVSDRTPLNAMVREGVFKVPNSSEYEKLFFYTHGFLTSHGYDHYEISNYAKPNCYSRHNMNYWQGGDYIGTGMSAVSTVGNRRIRNFTQFDPYYRALEKGKKPAYTVERLTISQKRRETVMLGLRTKRGLDVCEVQKMCGEKCREFDQYINLLVTQGYVRMSEGRFFLTPEGMIRSNTIISGFWDVLCIHDCNKRE